MSQEDEYERRFMSDGGLLYQSKAKAPLTFHLLVLMPILLSMLMIGPLVLAGVAPLLTLFAILPAMLITVPIWLLFSVLRSTVTRTHVHIQYGVFGPKIPLDAIASCESVTYDWKKYGGFGIRRAPDGSHAYNMMGDQGRAARLVWKDGQGRDVVTLLSAEDPDAFVRAVKKAKKLASAPDPKLRVQAASAPELAEAEREVEAELAADSERQNAASARPGRP